MIDAAIDPTAIPAKPMTREQLQWWVLFGICVANKPAKVTERKMREFMDLNAAMTPFGKVKSMVQYGELGRNLRKVRFGQYTRINKAFRHAVNLDVGNLSVEALELVPGIGPKTARMIMLYAKPGMECVPLDTHILKFLRKLGHKAPRHTPPAGPVYRRLELAFIAEAKRRKVSVRELDTEVWTSYSGYTPN
jgi:hypothetical protein